MSKRFPLSFYNPITLVGSSIAAISFGLVIFLVVLESFSPSSKPYMGVVAFVILPLFLLIGAAVAVFGILREHRRRRLGLSTGPHFPQIDFSNPRHRRGTILFAFGGITLLIFSAFASYKAYEHTDSDQFCGQTCHTPMEPEYTAYQFSPHARVGCAQCHIGSGAGWFVKSKISGSYQVYATLFNTFPRPIPTPIENLRPAQETCEQCHWPKHFFSEKLDKYSYYISDEKNTKWELDLVMKVGGGNIDAGPTSGIHWHMNITNEVRYIARDQKRLDIPWVQSKDSSGKVVVYQSTEAPLSDEEIATMASRRMDCIDCHNRPTHIYHPPARSVNHVMSLGWIDPTLPNAKSLSVETLERPYSTREAALDSIRLTVRDYYQTNYPDLMGTKAAAVDRMGEELQKIYSRSYFPEMRVSWKAVSDNIGHMYYPGCFRCHDGKHATPEGKVLSRDCNTCHTILAQQFESEKMRISLGGVDYKHPVDIGDAWKEMNCSDCHNSGD